MSGVAAVFGRDGRPIVREPIERMLALAAHRGPDARGVWTDGPIGLGHCLLRTTRHASPQPFVDGSYGVVFDGRLDNRGEIEAALPSNADLRAADDPALVVAAYRAWEFDAFRRLLGDFALALWDGPRRRLICARDIVGIKPLYYHASPHLFVCGSEVPQLFAAADISTEPNPGMVAEYLSLRVVNATETLFRDVHRVPAAHVLIVTADRVWTTQYYDPASAPDVRLRGDREYAEQFLATLTEAIRCRVPDDGRMAFYLSGGLDSSSLVCLSARLRRDGLLPAAEIDTLSMVAPGTPGDESSFIRDVVQHANVRSHEFTVGPPAPGVFVDDARRCLNIPKEPNVMVADPMVRYARDAGHRVILTGIGGDDWLCASWTHAADLVARGRWVEFAALVTADAAGGGPRAVVRAMVMKGLWPLVPAPLQSFVHLIRSGSSSPDYIDDRFAAATHLVDRLRRAKASVRGRTRPQRELLNWFYSGAMMRGHDGEDRHHSSFGVEPRHPFHDRRMIELVLGLPEHQRWRSETTKFVLREAVGHLLPESVRRRLDKGDFSHTFIAAFDACGGEACFQGMELADRGWIRPDIVLARYRAMRAAHAAGDLRYALWALRLWMIYGIELWLRHRAPR